MAAGDRVRELRNDRGWTAQRLAEEVARFGPPALSRGTIAKIESGIRKNLTTDELTVLARAFGVSPTELLGHHEPETPVPAPAQPVTRDHGHLIADSLARAYRAALDRPLTGIGSSDRGTRVPTLGEAYIEPHFRTARAEPHSRVASDGWWQEQPVRTDLGQFLAARLASAEATEAPTLVLGSPGSGKSMLARMLAARAAGTGFVPVLIKLREVAGDAPIQVQVEQAIFSATGEQVAWPEFARALAGAVPLIILDGVDELVQATGRSHSAYLQHVAEFQQREAVMGRPVAVVALGRTVVFDLIVTPPGTVAIRLEPFDDAQIRSWLETWNAANEPRAARRPLSIESLSPEAAELAREPLLLLMLAVMAEQEKPAVEGGRAELHRRLLEAVARREQLKVRPHLDGPKLTSATEELLERLTIAAFAGLNRRRDRVARHELDRDLDALHGSASSGTMRGSASAGPADLLGGRFFFTIPGEAPEHEEKRTYRFAYATLAEYLVAAEVLRTLEIATELGRRPHAMVDDGYLRALLSFSVLSVRPGVLRFLAELTDARTSQDRAAMAGAVLSSLRQAPYSSGDRFHGYQPQDLPITARIAAYTANLTLLMVGLTGELDAGRLFEGCPDPEDRLRREVLFWRSQLPAEDMRGLAEALGLPDGD